jgi:hypothetical protein
MIEMATATEMTVQGYHDMLGANRVTPGLVPGIHVFLSLGKRDVDGRNKSGHDE